MVHAIDAALFQPPGLFRSQEARRDADLKIVRLLDLGDQFRDQVEFPRCRAAAGGDDAIGFGLPLEGGPSAGEDLIGRDQGIAGDLGRGDPRLRAIAAVFGTGPALGVDEEVQSHLVSPPLAADAVRGGQEVQQLLVRAAEDRKPFVGDNLMSLKDAVSQFVPADSGAFVGNRVVLLEGIHAMIVAEFDRSSHCRNSPKTLPSPLGSWAGENTPLSLRERGR